MIYFTDLDFLAFSVKKKIINIVECLSPEMHHLEKKKGERIFKP